MQISVVNNERLHRYEVVSARRWSDPAFRSFVMAINRLSSLSSSHFHYKLLVYAHHEFHT